MPVTVFSHPSCLLHDNGVAGHPECPERIEAINNRLIASGVDWVIRHRNAGPASLEALHRVHAPAFVERVFRQAPNAEGFATIDGDTGMNRHSLDAALHAAGAVAEAVDLVVTEDNTQAFCLVRPPGHHATKDRASGFCLFNNIAVGAAQGMAVHGIERVLIVDFDVHHGDGTESIFGNDERVLFCSSFQHPFYPFSGDDSNAGNVINLPMPAGTGGREWRALVAQKWLPAMRSYRPGLIMISAGFDSHREDDMGNFNLVESDYAWITRELMAIARDSGHGRIVSSLEGGYDLSSLGRSATAHIKAMAEF